MKKQLPIILLSIVCVALAWGLYRSTNELAYLNKQFDEVAKELALYATRVQGADPTAPDPVVTTQSSDESEIPPLAAAAANEEKETSHQRMMKSMAKAMESMDKVMDNPTMNKVVEASQRGMVGALYSDLIEYLDLNAEETHYFMDLLMQSQMKIAKLRIKMMTGDLSDEEKKALAEEIKLAGETVQEGMENFLNNPDDFAEFEFYEKTMGERMLLSQIDQQLAAADASLSDEAYRELLGMMHDEKENFDFSTDLNDEENMDFSPERFSRENLQNYANDMDRLYVNIIGQAEGMLTAEQLEVFKDAIKTTVEMQKAPLDMAAQMFGGGEEPTAP